MNDLVCRDVEDLIIAYAADALEEEERCAVASHLAECRNHDAELNAVRGDFERLAVSAVPAEPPPGLRSGLLDAFDREIGRRNATPVEAPAPEPIARRQTPRRFWAAPSFGYALAAVLAIVAIGLGAWGISRGGGNRRAGAQHDPGQHRDARDLPQRREDRCAGRGPAAATAGQGVPGLVPGRRLHRHDQPRAARRATTGALRSRSTSSSSTAVALSVEPDGGSPAPTTAPLLVTHLN